MSAGFFDRFSVKRPWIVESVPPPSTGHGAGMQVPEYKSSPYFIVASVEMGNTTTKCILTGTNLETGRSYVINKTVSMSRDVRKPKPNETVFGATLDGTELTRESITDLVRDTLIKSHRDADLSIKDELDFVVRSTGVVAAMDSPDQVGEFVKALANGCLIAGVPPRKMTPPMGINSLPKKLRCFSYADRLVFTGAIAGVTPPIGATGVEMVANEMEGELAMAGIKEGAKWTAVDFRNPCISMDFGTTLDGRITSDVDPKAENPFAKTIGNFCGLAGAIPDAIIRGTGLVDKKKGTALDLYGETCKSSSNRSTKKAMPYVERCMEIVDITEVPRHRTHFGKVPVCADVAEDSGIVLIGVDIGVNGDRTAELEAIGEELAKNENKEVIREVVDRVCANTALKIIDLCIKRNFLPPNSSIGFTGRAIISGNKPQYILEGVTERGIYDDPVDHLVFVDDGLARGAALMGRCMNSIGHPKCPIGGVRGGHCIMAKRIKIGK
ncbi:MAG TPA: methanogenesis marker 14 protein [Methanocorpusculum sp.]|nr:methanogenesis marker 14 protein [Methanocorpusculum sp.]HJJ53030.1 methanogenesis marker 14 protein [Methanocorpusculum sp.]